MTPKDDMPCGEPVPATCPVCTAVRSELANVAQYLANAPHAEFDRANVEAFVRSLLAVMSEAAKEAECKLALRDDDGEWTSAGDAVRFCYGIPPVRVVAPIVERDGQLIGLCPDHNPPEFRLRSLRRYVGNWYRENGNEG